MRYVVYIRYLWLEGVSQLRNFQFSGRFGSVHFFIHPVYSLCWIMGFGGAGVRASGFHLRVRGFDSHYGLM